MIEIRDVSKRFQRPGGGGVDALRQLSCHVARGSVTAVVGPNGAGKSTLLALILGFLRPTTGRIAIDGLTAGAYVRANGAGYLPDRFALPPDWPVHTALIALARLDGHGRTAAGAATDALERFDLVSHANAPFGTLSRGLQQRVGLAQALLAPRTLTVLDEPTQGLDPLWRIRLRALVAGLRDRGGTVLLASHDLGEVQRLADRALLLDDGRLRDVLELQQQTAPGTWLVQLAAPHDAVGIAFPGAVDVAAGGAATWRVACADAAEFSARLAALLDAGAIVLSARPDSAALEERVVRGLERGQKESD